MMASVRPDGCEKRPSHSGVAAAHAVEFIEGFSTQHNGRTTSGRKIENRRWENVLILHLSVRGDQEDNPSHKSNVIAHPVQGGTIRAHRNIDIDAGKDIVKRLAARIRRMKEGMRPPDIHRESGAYAS